MTGPELLLLGFIALVVLAPGPSILINIGYYLRNGYVPVGWRKYRVQRAEHPALFWFLTKGRLLLLGVSILLALTLLATMAFA